MPARRKLIQCVAFLAALFTLTSTPANISTMSGNIISSSGRPLLDLQQEFLDLRFGMFLHFNLATFQDREWGDPRDPASVFAPTHLDTDQWAEAAKSAHMGYGCLTTKHHDGFCIWPTKTGVAHTLGEDVVAKYAASFRKAGLKVGLYFSILDLRNDIRHHNVTPKKIQLIKDQLTELLTNYGEISILIFDGWDAPWSRISYTEVPFQEIYQLVKKLQPNCLISELNASQYPASALYYSDIKAFEQNAGQHLPEDSKIPAQSCVTLTDGWFWKQSDQNAELKPTKTIVEEWLKPQNDAHCNLILNAAPNREGRLSENIIARLREIGDAWKPAGPSAKINQHYVITTQNLTTGRPVHCSSSPDTVGADEANDGSFDSTWRPEEGESPAWIEVDLGAGKEINTLVYAEPIGRWKDYAKSRIDSFRWEIYDGHQWREVAAGAGGHQVDIQRISSQRAQKVRLSFQFSHSAPHLSEIGVYCE